MDINNHSQNITDIMFSESKDIWDRLISNDFIVEMARGTLSVSRYRTYMLQDYAYLMAYLKVLQAGYDNSAEQMEKDYLKRHMDEIHEEIERVHVPAMKKLGIPEAEIDAVVMQTEIKEYTDYMLSVTEKGTFADCICAILACSWSYEYICDELLKNKRVDRNSTYFSWFESYSSKEYRASNSGLMVKVNEYASHASDNKKKEMKEIFRKCSMYELDFWNAL